MDRTPINPGTVDWSGENPGMYLKQTADGPFVTRISYFRVVLSPKGHGHAAFILQDPHGDGKHPARPNLCITDNEPMVEYLRDGFVANFGASKGIKGLAGTRLVPGWDFMRAGDGNATHVEWFRSSIGQVSLTWKRDSFYGSVKVVDYRHRDAHVRELTIDGLVQGGVSMAPSPTPPAAPASQRPADPPSSLDPPARSR